MITKQCIRCKEIKEGKEFRKSNRKTDGLSIYCRECSKSIDRKHYNKCKKKILERKNLRRNNIAARNKEIICKFKRYCIICKESRITCLNSHHLRKEDKSFTISESMHNKSIETLVKELNKCVTLCSNCHRLVESGEINLNNYLNLQDNLIPVSPTNFK